MPSAIHEMPLELIRDRPGLALELLEQSCGVPLPRSDPISIGSEACNLVKPLAAVKDRTVIVGHPNRPDYAIIVEVQRRRSRNKRLTWPLYLAVLRYVKKCPVLLLVICQDSRTAKKLSEPIRTGHPGWDLTPVVLPLERLPAVTDPEQARRMPGLSILSTPTHADGPEGHAVLTAYAAAIDACDPDQGQRYDDFTQSRLSPAAQQILEAIVPAKQYQWRSEFALKHQAEGEARGEARGRCQGEAGLVLQLLEARGIPITPQQREWISQCADEDTLVEWHRRAITAETADQVFG